MILTACSLDELDGGLLGLLLLEVDDGEGGAAGLDEGAAELVPETARGPSDETDLDRGKGGCERACRKRKRSARTLLAMEKSGRVLTTRALAAMLFNLATASSLLKRAWTARVRGVWGARRRVREVAGRVRARREGAMAAGGRWWGMWGEERGTGTNLSRRGGRP